VLNPNALRAITLGFDDNKVFKNNWILLMFVLSVQENTRISSFVANTVD